MSQKLDFSFVRPVGLCLDQAPYIDSSLFVGRAVEISQMHEALRPENGSKEQRRLVLGGMGGVGKTQLAIAYAKAKSDDYDSVFWINATSKATLQVSFKSMAEYIFDMPDTQNLTGEQVIAGIKKWLLDAQNTKWLLIFDNYDEPESYHLETYYPQTSHGTIIITTRSPDKVDTEAVKLRSLDNIEESLAILQKRSKRENVKNDESARRLAKRLAGLPLALVTAGTFLHKDKSTWSFEKYLTEYEKRWNIDPRRPPRLREYQDRTLYTTWDISYQRLQKEDPEAALMLKLLAYFGHQSVWYELFKSGYYEGAPRDDLPNWLMAVIKDSVAFESLMRVLIDYCFIEAQLHGKGYGMHTCIHDWTLASLNAQMESRSYWFAFDCVVNSIAVLDLDILTYLRFARYVPHAIRLMHNRFDDIACQLEEYNARGSGYLAVFLHKQAQTAAAEHILLSVIPWKQKVLGPEHQSTLTTIAQMGDLYHAQGRFDEAVIMYTQAMTGLEETLGLNHIATLGTVHRLGRFYADQGKLAEAEEMYVRVLAGYEGILGPKHTLTLDIVNNLAVLYIHQDKLGEAEQMILRAVVGYEEARVQTHIGTLDVVRNLGVVYTKQHKFGDAEQIFMRALKGCYQVLGDKRLSTLNALGNLASIYFKQGKLEEAETMYLAAVQGKKELCGPKHTFIFNTFNNLGQLYEVQGKLDEAEEMYTSALRGYEEVLGSEVIKTYIPALNAMCHLASLYRKDQKDRARDLLERALNGYRIVQGETSRNVIAVQRILDRLAESE